MFVVYARNEGIFLPKRLGPKIQWRDGSSSTAGPWGPKHPQTMLPLPQNGLSILSQSLSYQKDSSCRSQPWLRMVVSSLWERSRPNSNSRMVCIPWAPWLRLDIHGVGHSWDLGFVAQTTPCILDWKWWFGFCEKTWKDHIHLDWLSFDP